MVRPLPGLRPRPRPPPSQTRFHFPPSPCASLAGTTPSPERPRSPGTSTLPSGSCAKEKEGEGRLGVRDARLKEGGNVRSIHMDVFFFLFFSFLSPFSFPIFFPFSSTIPRAFPLPSLSSISLFTRSEFPLHPLDYHSRLLPGLTSFPFPHHFRLAPSRSTRVTPA